MMRSQNEQQTHHIMIRNKHLKLFQTLRIPVRERYVQTQIAVI
jgi:hypothetical protein